jgi:hypothetical protein
MKSLLRLSSLLLVAAALGGPALAASAPPGTQVMGGGYSLADFPIGDWGKIAGFGLGVDGSSLTRRNTSRAISMRTNLGLLYNFSRTQDVPAANLGPNDKLSLETKNTSLFFGVGPELSKPGAGTSFFIFGTAGFQTFWSVSNLSGTASGAPYSSKYGDSRIAFAWTGGGGVRKHSAHGDLVELSVEYRAGGQHYYVIPDQVTIDSGGNVVAKREKHNSDQIVLRLGTVLGK